MRLKLGFAALLAFSTLAQTSSAKAFKIKMPKIELPSKPPIHLPIPQLHHKHTSKEVKCVANLMLSGTFGTACASCATAAATATGFGLWESAAEVAVSQCIPPCLATASSVQKAKKDCGW